MKIIYIGMLILWMSIPVLIYGSSMEEFEYHFYQDDSSYSFRGSFAVVAELDCLLSLVYDIEHISKFASGAKTVELIQQGDNWNVVCYTYRKFIFFENRSTWRRTLNRDKHELVFEMISSENNLRIIPEMLSSKGYYRINPDDGGYRMEYFQECKLNPEDIRDSYIKIVKEKAIEFLHEFREYTEKICVDYCYDK
jgi:hypothetical protein